MLTPAARCGAARIPTAMEQRLWWKPAEGTVFRTMSAFTAQLAVYQFASGKRYSKREKKRSNDGTIKRGGDAIFLCSGCPEEGCICLQFQLHEKAGSFWVVKRVRACSCGAPSELACKLKMGTRGLLALRQRRDVVRKDEWPLLASACFPFGYTSTCIRVRDSPRAWSIHCQCNTDGCPGRLDTVVAYRNKNGGYRTADSIDVEEVCDCSCECKQSGYARKDSLVPTPFAYQSFHAENLRTRELRDKRVRGRTGAALESHTPGGLLEVLRSLSGADGVYERLDTMRQSALFDVHEHEVLNFLDAVEFLNVQRMDFGFLQRVAHAAVTGYGSREALMRQVYRHGWGNKGGDVDDHLILALLVRRGLVKLVNLVEDGVEIHHGDTHTSDEDIDNNRDENNGSTGCSGEGDDISSDEYDADDECGFDSSSGECRLH